MKYLAVLIVLALSAAVALSEEQQPVGTTIGMMLANGPAIWLGARMGHRLPLRLIRALAGLMFAAMGLWVFIEGIPAF